jgi:hypothetical protein
MNELGHTHRETLLERLSRLGPPGLPADMTSGMPLGLEARLLKELGRHRRSPRFRWEPLFLAFLCALLGWDLARIIGYLLG